jgi:hypothetical protein
MMPTKSSRLRPDFKNRVQRAFGDGKVSPNIGRPLRDWVRSASSWMTSHCSASLLSAMRTMSTTTQLIGRLEKTSAQSLSASR